MGQLISLFPTYSQGENRNTNYSADLADKLKNQVWPSF